MGEDCTNIIPPAKGKTELSCMRDVGWSGSVKTRIWCTYGLLSNTLNSSTRTGGYGIRHWEPHLMRIDSNRKKPKDKYKTQLAWSRLCALLSVNIWGLSEVSTEDPANENEAHSSGVACSAVATSQRVIVIAAVGQKRWRQQGNQALDLKGPDRSYSIWFLPRTLSPSSIPSAALMSERPQLDCIRLAARLKQSGLWV